MHEPQATPARPYPEPPAAPAPPGAAEISGVKPGEPRAPAVVADAGPAEPIIPEPPSGDRPRPLGAGVQPTGHDGVDAQLRRLEEAGHLAVSLHLGVYEDVHRALRDTLTALDQRPGPAPVPAARPGPSPRS